jgi:uncharacterized protein YbjT (DUF2867 family)
MRMEKGIYVVTGATGNIGRVIAERLLSRGEKVRVIGRSEQRLLALSEKGAEPLVGSLDDADFLRRAFKDARIVFTMIPPNYTTPESFRAYQGRITEAFANAIKDSGVTHVVNLSSIGAHLPDGTGPIKGLHDAEQRFNQLEDVNVVHLRPTFFMENLLAGVEIIRKAGVNGGPALPDVPTPMIATRDIAEAAAQLMLADPPFTGKQVRELLGPRDYTMDEVTKVLGRAIGRDDLQYVQFPYAEVRQAMLAQGMSESVVKEMIELSEGSNAGLIRPTEERSRENTTATTLEEFAAETFAPVYRAGSGTQNEAAGA